MELESGTAKVGNKRVRWRLYKESDEYVFEWGVKESGPSIMIVSNKNPLGVKEILRAFFRRGYRLLSHLDGVSVVVKGQQYRAKVVLSSRNHTIVRIEGSNLWWEVHYSNKNTLILSILKIPVKFDESIFVDEIKIDRSMLNHSFLKFLEQTNSLVLIRDIDEDTECCATCKHLIDPLANICEVSGLVIHLGWKCINYEPARELRSLWISKNQRNTWSKNRNAVSGA